MRSVPVLVAMALGAVLLASGCGQQHAGTPAGPPLSPPASAPPVPSPVPGDPGAASCHNGSPTRATSITITYADNGQTLCVRQGTAVQVYLKGTQANRWSAIHASGDALIPHASGQLMLALGVTGASFLAAHPGTATLRSFQQPCGPNATPGNQAAQSGTLECGVIIAFHATVKVS
jgi:hypothetical protein